MSKKTSKIVRRLRGVLVFLGLFVGGILLEGLPRAAMAVPIPIDRSQANEVTITASRMPDFLWVGFAWSINYESPVPFDMDIGSGSSTRVPAGKHRIVSNHDVSNLDEYGLRRPKDFPKVIIIRGIQP